jgi:Recombinase.
MNNQKSEVITAGMRQGFRDGTSKLAKRVCYGYEYDEHGELVVFVPEAMVVLQIFNLYNMGNSLGQIADYLAERKILSPSSRPRWNREALGKLLRNEKYVGQVRLQKTIVRDGKQVANREVDQYIYTNNHPAIITVEAFEETQMRLHERSKEVQQAEVFEQSM